MSFENSAWSATHSYYSNNASSGPVYTYSIGAQSDLSGAVSLEVSLAVTPETNNFRANYFSLGLNFNPDSDTSFSLGAANNVFSTKSQTAPPGGMKENPPQMTTREKLTQVPTKSYLVEPVFAITDNLDISAAYYLYETASIYSAYLSAGILLKFKS